MATHSRIAAWEIPWIEEPGGLQCMRSQRMDPTKQQEEMVMVLSTGMALRMIHFCTPNCPEENIPRKGLHSAGNGEVLESDGKGAESVEVANVPTVVLVWAVSK